MATIAPLSTVAWDGCIIASSGRIHSFNTQFVVSQGSAAYLCEAFLLL